MATAGNRNETVKTDSRFLRGTIRAGLGDPLTGAVPDPDPLLLKFHGLYQQDDRDVRADRQRRKLEPLFQFMVRLRLPGGVCSSSQWLALDTLARRYAERGLRITTRQTVQLHGVRKQHLRGLLAGLRAIGLDTLAACGDDNRGVVCGFAPQWPAINDLVAGLARTTSERLLPHTGAYRETWYGELPATTVPDSEEPLYGAAYLPRKFKIGFAIPPVNDIDVHAQDLGFIAIVDGGWLAGFNVCVGGGMGRQDNRPDTYPCLAQEIGFAEPHEVLAIAEAVIGIQRDCGNREDRHRARFKYTLETLGMPEFLRRLQQRRHGRALAPARPYRFACNGDRPGWVSSNDGLHHVTLCIDSGRIAGRLQDDVRSLLQGIACSVRLTPNQNLVLGGLSDEARHHLGQRLATLGLSGRTQAYHPAATTLACVALPTCGLALAEAERYLPDFQQRFEALKARHGLSQVPVHVRITGCPNGCARPYLAEVALTGRAPGLYNLYLGGSQRGDRLAQRVASNVDEPGIFSLLDGLLGRFAAERHAGEAFGDFWVRTATGGLDVPATGKQEE